MPPAKRSNASLLSEGAAYIKKKRRNAGKEVEVEKVVFDDEARASVKILHAFFFFQNEA